MKLRTGVAVYRAATADGTNKTVRILPTDYRCLFLYRSHVGFPSSVAAISAFLEENAVRQRLIEV